ncbi:8234_t:CDS:2, partial [Funneliformis mosseae]
MAFEFFPGLSQNFSQLLENADDYDIIIKVGKNPNTKKFHAHSNILKAQLGGKDANNLDIWNKKDFLALKNTLNQFITHIRFFDISSKDFHSFIWPFKKVLPREIFEDIVSFHMLNADDMQNKSVPRHKKISIDSMIIKSKHVIILTNWIQRKDSNAKISKDNKCNFNLIYRGSRDGFDINTIRNICNGKGACILIIKTKENGTIIGGNGNDLKNLTISRVVNESVAMYESNYQNMSLNFGNSDLVINNNTGTCNQAQYE